jgi:hypothetical protein
MTTQTFTGTLTVIDCPACGMPFGITTRFETQRRDDHTTFYCPAGHGQSFRGKSALEQERDRLKASRDRAVQSEQWWRRRAEQERRSAAAQKGHRTRVLNLIAKGVCPVAGCRRNFTNVREHMATQHPDFHTHEEQA